MAPESSSKATKNAAEDRIVNWLNKQEQGSVIYVSFGTIATPNAAEVQQIGEALSQLGRPFLWSLKEASQVHLPAAIIDTIRNPKESDSFLVVSWVPQKVVLTNPAVGVFLSHAGWNSTLEALANGVPMVVWPMFGDQLINAEWIDGEGVGRIIRGTGKVPDRNILAEEIARGTTRGGATD